jgi:hypothetical protein
MRDRKRELFSPSGGDGGNRKCGRGGSLGAYLRAHGWNSFLPVLQSVWSDNATHQSPLRV